MIGLSSLKNGLYHLALGKQQSINTTLPFINSTIHPAITPNNLWHFRLGHLSDNRLDILHHKFPFISKHSNEFCDVCHLAKQRKLSYSFSKTQASHSFELLHLDIWGPLFMVTNIF